MIVATQEGWIQEPLSFYRMTGTVQLLHKLAQSEKDSRFLFVCGSHKLLWNGIKGLNAQQSLLQT